MGTSRIAAVVLILVGVLALAYGGFTYTSDTHEARVGSLSMSVDERKRVNIPVWAGAGAVVAGGLLFLFSGHRRR